jgi:hypothetical protein
VKIIKFELLITFVTPQLLFGFSMPQFGCYMTHHVVSTLCRTQTTQSDPWRVDTTAGVDFLELCDQKCSYKHVSGFGRWWCYEYFLLLVNAQGTERRKSVRDIEPAGGLCNQLGGLSLALQTFLFPPGSLRQLTNIRGLFFFNFLWVIKKDKLT